MNADDTLAHIDDVITWHGSADAMVWTANEPKQPDLTAITQRFTASMQAFTEAIPPSPSR